MLKTKCSLAFMLICVVSARANFEQDKKEPKGKIKDRTEIIKMAQKLTAIVEDSKLTVKARTEAARELGQLGDKRSAENLVNVLPNADEELFYEIAVALGKLKNVDVFPRLETIQKKSGKRSEKSLSALGKTMDELKKDMARLEEKLKIVEDRTADLKTKAAAAREIGEIGSKGSAPVLVGLLPAAEGPLFVEIAYALGKIESLDVLPLLIQIQESPSDRSGKCNSALQYAIVRLTAIKEAQSR
jgi:HEAT repeat protein